MDPEEQARRDNERVVNSRERLRARVDAKVREFVLGSALFRAHPELGQPDVFVHVYSQFVHVVTSLNGAQLSILPIHGRTRDLNHFAEELRERFERLATDLHMTLVTEPGGPFGKSTPVMVIDTPSGYWAVLSRPHPDWGTTAGSNRSTYPLPEEPRPTADRATG